MPACSAPTAADVARPAAPTGPAALQTHFKRSGRKLPQPPEKPRRAD